MAKLHLNRNVRDSAGAGGRDYPAGYYEIVDSPSDPSHMDRDFAARVVAAGYGEEAEEEQEAQASEDEAPASEAPEASDEEKERAEAARRIASGGSSRKRAPAAEAKE